LSIQIKLEYYPIIKEASLKDAINIIEANKKNWDATFFVDTRTYVNLDEIQETIKKVDVKKIENVIVLGTGGSIQTLLAVKHLAKKNIFPITSSRAVELKDCLSKTKPNDSIVIPISRAGETLDINSTIGIFLKKGYKFLGLSSTGVMYNILKKINCPILDVPDLTGRFAGSISNVGIVPAYISGVNVDKFLKGLEDGYKLFMNFKNNEAITFSSFMFKLYNLGYRIVFSMPYSKSLEGSVGLFVQEVSESTGKEGKGLIGAYQEAPLCQHSILEFLLGGSKGVVIPLLWTIEKEFDDLTLESSIDYVNGQSAQTIVNYQADATYQALIEQKVPSAKIKVNTPDEYAIGNLISFIQSSIYYLSLLLNVNWANNPKVVIGKKICNEALIKKVPTNEREEIRKKIATDVFKDFWK